MNDKKIECPRHGGAWGDDETCERCTFEDGTPRPTDDPGPMGPGDMTNARYWAISGTGYGRGFNPGEAQENYVDTLLRDYPASMTIFKTPKKWEAALRTGEAKATHFHAPEGTTGFVLSGGGVRWTKEVDGKTVYVEVSEGERLEDDRG